MSQKGIVSNNWETVTYKTLPKDFSFNSGYNLYNVDRNKFIGKDSTIKINYSNGNLKSIANYAKNILGEITTLKMDDYELYSLEGQLIEKGKFNIGRYAECCTGELCSQFYNYKYDEWIYYYSTGKQRAQVNYEAKEYHIDNGCEGGDKVVFSKVKISQSNFWDSEGFLVKPSGDQIKELETVTYSQRKHRKIALSIENNKVKQNVTIVKKNRNGVEH